MRHSVPVLALILVSTAFAGQDGTVLRRTLADNSTDTYKVKAKVQQNMDVGGQTMDINMTANSTVTLKTLSIDSSTGLATVSLGTTVDSIDADGPMADMVKSNMPKPTLVKGTLDKLGMLTLDTSKLTSAEAMSEIQSGGGRGVLIQFPEKAVKVGDSWEMLVPKGPTTYPSDQTLTAKLTGEQKVGDKDAWVVSIEGTIKADVDLSKFAAAEAAGGVPADAHFTGSSKVSGTALIEKSTGRLLHAEGTEKSTNQVEIPSVGQTVNVTSTSTTTTDLS